MTMIGMCRSRMGIVSRSTVVVAVGNWEGVLWLMLSCAGAGIALTVWLGMVEKKQSL